MRIIVGLACSLVCAVSTSASAVTLGIVGDSVSDEYHAPSGGVFLGYEGLEWGELLVRHRDVSLGNFDSGLNAFGAPNGYAYNHALKGQALSGENSFDKAFPGFGPLLPGLGSSGQSFAEQATALAANFAAGEIDAAVIQGGSNDVIIHNFLGNSFATEADFQAIKTNIVDGFAAILDTPVPGASGMTLADQRIILAELPVFGVTAQQQAAIGNINTALRVMATSKGVATFSHQATVFARTNFGTTPLAIEGESISLLSVASNDDLVDLGDAASVGDGQCGFSNGAAPFGNGSGTRPAGTAGCPTRAYQLNLLQDDFTHATTLGSGFIANDILAALNAEFGFDLPLLTDREILDAALGVPEPGTAILTLLGLGLLAARARQG